MIDRRAAIVPFRPRQPWRTAAVLGSLLGIVTGKVPAQAAPEPWTAAIAEGRAAVQAALREGAIPAAAVAVAVDGRIVWSEAFGDATRESRFGIGSISKTLTLAAALTLADRGRLDLDAPLERYLPDWPHRGRGVTVRRIGVHQSGLADEFANRHYASTTHIELDSAYRAIRNERLAYEPGTRTEYATGVFTIVSRVLERVTGTAYAELMRRLVFEPAGMAHTTPNDPRKPARNRARFYVRGGGGIEEAPTVDPTFKLPGAGFLSTADDIARFGAALLQGELLSPRARDEMFRPVPRTPGSPAIYALGFQVLRENDRRTLLQSGGGLGIASWLALYPDDGVVVALLSNLTAAPLEPTRAAIAERFLTVKRER